MYTLHIYIYTCIYIYIHIYCVYVYNCIYASPILATLSRSIRYLFYTAVGDSDIPTGPPFGPDLRMDVFEVSGCAGSEVAFGVSSRTVKSMEEYHPMCHSSCPKNDPISLISRVKQLLSCCLERWFIVTEVGNHYLIFLSWTFIVSLKQQLQCGYGFHFLVSWFSCILAETSKWTVGYLATCHWKLTLLWAYGLRTDVD